MNNPHVAIVILHWLNVDDTVECLQSLTHVNYPALTVIAVNNGSPDFDAHRFLEAMPSLVIVNAPHNLGYSAGNNLGIEEALRHGAEWIMLLNNDTIVEPELIEGLLPVFEQDHVGIVGPVITHYDNPRKIWFAGGTYVDLVGYSYRTHPMQAFEGWRESDWLNGCAFCIKREVIENVGMLWDDLFLYCEDLEYSLRAVRAGYRCVTVGTALVHHKISSSAGAKGDDKLSPNKAYYFARNYILTIKRHAHGWWLFSGIVSQFFIILPLRTLMMARSGSLSSLSHYLNGLWHGLRGHSGQRQL